MAQQEQLTGQQVVAFIRDALASAYHLGTQGDHVEQATVVADTTRLVADWVATCHTATIHATIDEVAARANDHLVGTVVGRTAAEVATALGCHKVGIRQLGHDITVDVVTADGEHLTIPVLVEPAPDDASSITDAPKE